MKGGNQTIIEWCLANGATSTQYSKALVEAAQVAGATASDVNTAIQQMLVAAGYTGSLSDMWEQHLAAGLPSLGGGAATYDLTVGNHTSLYGYDGAVYMYGSLSPTDFDDLGSTVTIQRVYANIADTLYMYLSVAGDRTGQTIEFATPGFNGGNPIIVYGQVGYWSSNAEAGLQAYLASQVGNTIEITLERTA